MLFISCFSTYVSTIHEDQIAETLARMEAGAGLSEWTAVVFACLPSVLMLLLTLGVSQFFGALGMYGYFALAAYDCGTLFIVSVVGFVYFIRTFY